MSTTTATSQATLQEFTNGGFIQHKIESLEYPYRDAQVLRYLYWECAMSLAQIGDMFGVDGEGTVWEWMERHDIERRDSAEGLQIRELRDGPFCRHPNNTTSTDSSTESKWSFED